MFNYFSATLKNVPEDFDFCSPSQRSDKDLKRFVIRVEATFDLPPGALACRKKRLAGHSLSDIRAAIAVHLSDKVEITCERLAPIIGLSNHSSISKARHRAKDWIDTGDSQFKMYYGLISQMPV